MDTSQYIKKCPRCGTEIEPERYATTGDKALSGVMAASGAAAGFAIGGPVGAIIGGVVGYFGGKKAIMSLEDDCQETQWFIYKCPNCGCEWKERIHTNDDPDDPSWLGNAPY